MPRGCKMTSSLEVSSLVSLVVCGRLPDYSPEETSDGVGGLE